MRVQSWVLAKSRFPTRAAVRAWAHREGVPIRKIDETSSSFRLRQFPPSHASFFRSKPIAPGVTAVLGCVASTSRENPTMARRPHARRSNVHHRVAHRHALAKPPAVSTGAKVAIGAVAIGGLVAIMLYAKNASASANASSSSTTPSTPTTPTTPTTGGLSPTDGGRGQAAVALGNALHQYGYCQSKVSSLTTAYQQQAAQAVDGYPGQQTMTALNADLASMAGQTGVPASPVTGPNGVALPLYPWAATGAYDNVNAPSTWTTC
jgi:hypothetical protein